MHLGKGKAALKSLLPKLQTSTKIQIPLTFYIGTNLNSPIPDGFKKGVIQMKATLYDAVAARGKNLTRNKTMHLCTDLITYFRDYCEELFESEHHFRRNIKESEPTTCFFNE